MFLAWACAPPSTPSTPPARAEAPVAPATPVPSPPPAPPADGALAPGFELGEITLPTPSFLGDVGVVHYVRLDPARVRLDLRVGNFDGRGPRPAWMWADDDGPVVAVINAGMFEPDQTSTGYLADDGRVQTATWRKDYRSAFATDPVDPTAPAARVFGCADAATITGAYRTVVQSLRLVGCAGENTWSQQPKRWSTALVGMDADGRILFLHTRAPYSMHDLVDLLLASPLRPVALHYGEGGPEASLYVRGPGVATTWVGSYETDFREADDNERAWAIPNVIVATPRAPQGRTSNTSSEAGPVHTSR